MTAFSLVEMLAARCDEGPDVPAIIDANGGVLTRRQLLHKIRAISRGFAAAGLELGDRVLFAVRPDAEAIILMMAIAETGGVLVPLDATMGPALFRSRMALLAPAWVVAESVLYAAMANRLLTRLLAWRGASLPPVAELKNARFVRVGPKWPGAAASLASSALEKAGAQSDDIGRVTLSDDSPAIIVFTSGTTDALKAVVHTWRSMQGVFDTVGSLLETGSDDVIYAHELHLILPALIAGSTVVVPRRSAFSVKRTLRDLKEFRVTHLFAVASELQQLAHHLRSRKRKLPQSLREIWIGAAPVRPALLKDLQVVLAEDTRVWCVYGLTEILPVARVSLEEKLQYSGKGDLVGECVPGVTARISAQDELLLRGPNLFFGYFGEPPCTELATGDLARLERGRIVLLGRRKDMIIRGQFNIYPELYETSIERIDGVSRCAMVGLNDATRADERVVLAVEADADVDGATLEERLWRELTSGQFSIDAAALPDDILVMPLPLAGRSGKVDKRRLRDIAKRAMTCASR